MKPEQIRMARAALQWGVRKLAEEAEISPATLTRFETGKGGINQKTVDKLRRKLVDEGIIFIDENGEGAGVRLSLKSMKENADRLMSEAREEGRMLSPEEQEAKLKDG